MIVCILWLTLSVSAVECVFPFVVTPLQERFSVFQEDDIQKTKEEVRSMFYFGYDNYMNYAFPADELDPIHCTGRGHDHANVDNININDVLGDYSLTLIDSLDSLVVFGDTHEFCRAVSLVIDNVSFDKNTTVQVFEATIRVIGSLLSAHMIATDESNQLGDFYIPEYEGQLLSMARDLATRLLSAFDGTKTGIPYTRVNLQKGVLPNTVNETCTAGAGSLIVEFGILSRLTKDETFELSARRVLEKLWSYRDNKTGLLGNLMNIQTGKWVGTLNGLGAGLDSFYEYLFKGYILFGRSRELNIFNEAFDTILENLRRGRGECVAGDGEHPVYVNVDSRDGSLHNTWIDSLQASFAGLLVLAGEIDEAICQHALYYAIWKKYGVLPERYNWRQMQPEVYFYPLRPEFAESTYLLYRATKNPFYLNVGKEIVESLNQMTKVKCGYATVHNVLDGTLEDRMESFFLSETVKYLYLLFDINNPVNKNEASIVFSTEGHIFPVDSRLRSETTEYATDVVDITYDRGQIFIPGKHSAYRREPSRNSSCENPSELHLLSPPLNDAHLNQLFDSVGLPSSILLY